MRDRDRPRLAKFLSYGDNNIGSLGSQFPGYYVSQIYIPTTGATTVNNNNNNNVSYPPPKPPTSPTSKRKSRSKTKAKRSQSKHLKQEQSTTPTIFDGFPSLETSSPPRKRRSPSKSRVRRSQSRPLQVILDPSGGQVFSLLPPQQSQEPPPSSSSPTRRGRSRSKAKVKRTLSIASVSNVENEPPAFSPSPSDPPTDKQGLAISANNENMSPAQGGGGKKSRNRHKLKIRRSQSEAPHRANTSDGGGKSLWGDITQAKENIQSYIYKSTGQGKPPPATVVTNDRCQCSDNIYPQYPVLANLNSRGRSKSRSRRSVVSSTTAGPYSLGSSPYVAPREADDITPASISPTPASSGNNVTSISVPGVGVRGRSKSRSRLSASITNGMSTVWPDSRGAWLPV